MNIHPESSIKQLIVCFLSSVSDCSSLVKQSRKGASQLFDRETVLNKETFGFRRGLSKEVLLMVGKAFRRLQGKEMRKGKGAGARRALLERYNQAR